ncbi:hypothetical protein C8J57DRAFT_1244445 [Mycena rebaudengoi]|nr:hypothetical protein C8J57DRAFT_1244445 [Mycena rebaudengoi]
MSKSVEFSSRDFPIPPHAQEQLIFITETFRSLPKSVSFCSQGLSDPYSYPLAVNFYHRATPTHARARGLGFHGELGSSGSALTNIRGPVTGEIGTFEETRNEPQDSQLQPDKDSMRKRHAAACKNCVAAKSRRGPALPPSHEAKGGVNLAENAGDSPLEEARKRAAFVPAIAKPMCTMPKPAFPVIEGSDAARQLPRAVEDLLGLDLGPV